MARELELKRLQLLNRQVEKEKLQNSRDFKEITLSITLLAGLSAFLLKIIDYFNNNTVSYYLQNSFYFLVDFLLIEFLIILLFFILKGISVSTKNRNEKLANNTPQLFKFSFIYPLLWIIASILAFLFNYLYKNLNESPYYNYIKPYDMVIANGYILLSSIIIGWIFIDLWDYRIVPIKDEIKYILNNLIQSLKKIKKYEILKLSILLIVLLSILPVFSKLIIDLYLVVPSYLLMGSFFIDVFPQSNTDHEILTFTIKETGLTSGVSFITLSKLNAGNNSLELIDNITIPLQNTSLKKLMFGGIHETNYYFNINTSNLSSGNYMMHAEVTFDLTKNSTFGVVKKHDDRLFYISPKNVNYSSSLVQEPKGNLKFLNNT